MKTAEQFLEQLENHIKERAEFYNGRNYDRHCVYMSILTEIIKFRIEQKQVDNGNS